MSGLLVGVQSREQLDPILTRNLDEMLAAIETEFTSLARGENMPLLLGLQSPEQLPPIVRDELDQLMASIQTAFNSQVFNTFIKSYTEYQITLGAGDNSKTKTIPAVAMANTELVWLGLNTAEPAPFAAGTAYITLTNATTVTAVRRGDLATTSLDVRFAVLEYQPNVLRQAVQYGTIVNAASDGSLTAKILAVGPRAKLCFLGYDTDYIATSNPSRIQGMLKLLNTTTVTAYRNTGGADGHIISFCVVDFK